MWEPNVVGRSRDTGEHRRFCWVTIRHAGQMTGAVRLAQMNQAKRSKPSFL